MITIIFGKPGAGKTSLMTHFMTDIYENEGDELLEKCRERILEQNATRLHPLPLPEEVPLFSNFGVKFTTGYRKEYSPYFFNPYYFGVENDDYPVQYLLPCGNYFIDEGQRYFNSRRSLSLRDHVSKAFELHRQFEINIFIGCQRPKLIDLNIRELTPRFLEALEMKNETTAYGGIVSSTWRLKEYTSTADVLEYLEKGEETGHEIEPVVHVGNIFECFDSFEQGKRFYPKDEEGRTFSLLPFGDRDSVPEDLRKIYEPGEPKWYRSKEREETA